MGRRVGKVWRGGVKGENMVVIENGDGVEGWGGEVGEFLEKGGEVWVGELGRGEEGFGFVGGGVFGVVGVDGEVDVYGIMSWNRGGREMMGVGEREGEVGVLGGMELVRVIGVVGVER